MGLVLSKSLSTKLWSAHFPGRSLSDTEAFPKLVSPYGAENLLLVAWEGHRANTGPSIHRTQFSGGKGMAALRLDAVLDVLSNSTSQILD